MRQAAADAGGDEEEEEEEEGEEGEEEGEGEEAAEEAEEQEPLPTGREDVFPLEPMVASTDMEERYFMHGENLKNKFNEIELDSFMKLLNVKPHK